MQAQAVLVKQRNRLVDVASAFLQWADQIRTCDLQPEDLEAIEGARKYLEIRRRPVGREESVGDVRQERVG